MPEHLQPPAPISISSGEDNSTGEGLRILSRSPHPYHRRNFELLDPSDSLVYRNHSNTSDAVHEPRNLSSSFTKESTPASDSGTEADDEHFLKRLPAPRTRLHKGLRGQNESLSGTSTPLPSPALLEEEGRSAQNRLKTETFAKKKRVSGENVRRRKEVVRRLTEVFLLAVLGYFVRGNQHVQPFLVLWKREITAQSILMVALLCLYPARLVMWAYREGTPSRIIPISIPSSFDPAPILYPQVIPIFVSLLLALNVKGIVLPNLVLSLSTLPRSLIPGARHHELYTPLHWILSCLPIFMSDGRSLEYTDTSLPSKEALVLLYPLHQQLCMILHYLTTTSLLTAELQLLSVALINLLILSYSPQAVILKAMLWGGGLAIVIFCGPVINWGIALARVPKWRFRRVPGGSKGFSPFRTLRSILSSRRAKHGALGTDIDDLTSESGNTSDDDYELNHSVPAPTKRLGRKGTGAVDGTGGFHLPPPAETFAVPSLPEDDTVRPPPPRRHTLQFLGGSGAPSKTHTPSGRRKRSASMRVRYFFSLTQGQAATRKWIYAGYVYACILATIFLGVREYVKVYALSGEEPVGWALGYLFGDLPSFRFQVVKANLERWVCLPMRLTGDEHVGSCHQGWVQHLRHASFGEANTRLIISGYWLAIIATGLAVVFQLSPIYEVDTRRKVFHFMMVAMLLPATYVDPAYAALALSLILAVFLLLDLLRASQLPPLSKPIATFLTPYVDGRDLRGPVVISHIFLLIGCATPLWLSLAALRRVLGDGPFAGWEVPTREVSMVSGVVCVGLGDSAASLIGRRWGHRKWVWGGGKSLEGSVAFAVAVFLGLMAAKVWLLIGGWPSSTGSPAELWSIWSWGAKLRNTAVCASLASLTEAVLTGGNDNVVVPVVLWTCVKGLDV